MWKGLDLFKDRTDPWLRYASFVWLAIKATIQFI